MAIKTSKYKIMFYHKILTTEEITESHGVPLSFGEQRQCTMATLSKIDDSSILNEYIAITNPIDNFCKATGRKIALEGVLDCNLLTKEERKEVWEEYFRKFSRKL